MSPVTFTGIFGIILYVTLVFQGLKPAESVILEGADRFVQHGAFFAVFILKVLICFAVLGITNLAIFEAWVRKRLLEASKVLAWDPKNDKLSEAEVRKSILDLLDFPHRFIVRFLIHWIIGAPLIILSLRIFYPLPPTLIGYLSLGTVSIMCLMATFHYFVVKATYDEPLTEALKKYPRYYERNEFAKRRVAYRTKILIYIVVLVGAIGWLTTHLSLVAQERSSAIQRHEYIGQRIESTGIADAFKYRVPSAFELDAKVHLMLGGNGQSAYVLNKDGKNLLEKDIPPLEQKIINQIPRVKGVERPTSLQYWKEAFVPKPLLIRITDRVVRAYADGKQFAVTVDPIGSDNLLVTIQRREKTLLQAFMQMSTVLGMFIVALIISALFARYMQKELTVPLTKIINSSRKVAEGDLSDPEPIMADDELGEISVHHLRMVSSIKLMVRQLGEAAKSLDNALKEIRSRTDQMVKGSESQSVAVEQTTAAISEMNQTIGNIAESVETMASSAEESSASIIEMSATNDEVASSTEDLSTAVVETTASVTEMSASIKEVADHVQSTAEKASEASSSMKEMREAVKQVDRIAADSARVSEQVTRDAESGSDAVKNTISGIDNIWESSKEAAEVIERLSKRAREIGRILTVIEEVTEETNLLALNAAIIAAQAGEHGRGFAVVADEIKDLAERTQASTAEIAEQIGSVQEDARDAVSAMERGEESVSKGVLLSEEAGEALRKIQESAEKSLEMAKLITESTVEQSAKSDTVLSFFENITSMIEQISTATYEQTKGSEQIIMASERMRDISVQVKKATKEQSIGGKQISQSIEHISQIANYINSSQSEQRKAAHQVLQAMTRIADIAQTNMSGVEQVSGAVSNLKTLSDDLKTMLDTFCADDENIDEVDSCEK